MTRTGRCSDCGRAVKRHCARFCDGCRWRHRGKPAKWVWTPERDALLRQRYDGRKGCAVALARALAFPRSAVTRRAQELGLTVRATDRREWTRADVAFLEEHAGARVAGWIARKLGRPLSSVTNKIKRLKLSRAIRDGYTLRDLELCFGVDHHAIDGWIRQGWLVGERRHGGATPAFSRDAHRFSDRDVLRFIREHPTAFALQRVDQTWFLDLVLGGERASWRVA